MYSFGLADSIGRQGGACNLVLFRRIVLVDNMYSHVQANTFPDSRTVMSSQLLIHVFWLKY